MQFISVNGDVSSLWKFGANWQLPIAAGDHQSKLAAAEMPMGDGRRPSLNRYLAVENNFFWDEKSLRWRRFFFFFHLKGSVENKSILIDQTHRRSKTQLRFYKEVWKGQREAEPKRGQQNDFDHGHLSAKWNRWLIF